MSLSEIGERKIHVMLSYLLSELCSFLIEFIGMALIELYYYGQYS